MSALLPCSSFALQLQGSPWQLTHQTNDESGKKRKVAIESESEGEDDGEEWTGIAEDGEDSDEEDAEGDLPTFAGLKASELDDEDSEEEIEPEPKFDRELASLLLN